MLDSPDGEGLKELQGDSYVTGAFSFVAMWDTSDEFGDLYASEAWIATWEPEIWATP